MMPLTTPEFLNPIKEEDKAQTAPQDRAESDSAVESESGADELDRVLRIANVWLSRLDLEPLDRMQLAVDWRMSVILYKILFVSG